MSAFYAEDLAHIHDQGFGSFAQAATPFVLRTLASRATGNPVVVELGCGSGITASLNAFVLTYLGHPEVSVYDGSWAEWGNTDDVPIATGDGPE